MSKGGKLVCWLYGVTGATWIVSALIDGTSAAIIPAIVICSLSISSIVDQFTIARLGSAR